MTTRISAPSAANWLLRTTVIITTDDMTPATGISDIAMLPALPSGRLGGASMVRAAGAAGGLTVLAGRWISRVLIVVVRQSRSVASRSGSASRSVALLGELEDLGGEPGGGLPGRVGEQFGTDGAAGRQVAVVRQDVDARPGGLEGADRLGEVDSRVRRLLGEHDDRAG